MLDNLHALLLKTLNVQKKFIMQQDISGVDGLHAQSVVVVTSHEIQNKDTFIKIFINFLKNYFIILN